MSYKEIKFITSIRVKLKWKFSTMKYKSAKFSKFSDPSLITIVYSVFNVIYSHQTNYTFLGHAASNRFETSVHFLMNLDV